MKQSLYRGVIGLFLLFLITPTSSQATTEELPLLEPLDVHPRATRFVVDQVQSNHLVRNIPLDNEASSKIFDKFLESLDARKNFLLASDIEEFELVRYQLDDDLKRGRLNNAFAIINRVQKRKDDRYEWTIERLKQGITSFDLKTNGEIPIDPDLQDWAADIDESDQRWEDNLVDSIIRMKLNDQDLEQIQDVLTKRYTNRRNRNRQYTSEEAFSTFVNSFTEIFDPHTVYFSPRSAEDFHMNMRMSLEGIGALLGTEDEYVKVLEIVPGGPAEQDGQLQPGNLILAVGQGEDGPLIDVIGRRLNDVVDLIRGPKGSVVHLEVVKSISSSGENKIIKLVRDNIKLEETKAKKKRFSLNQDGADYNIGVIELPRMYADLQGERNNTGDYASASRDVARLVNELKAEEIDALIVDLRNNGGGSLPEAHRMVGLFIDKGPTVQVKGLGKNREVMRDSRGGMIFDGPLAVLVNRTSASASEIFAGAIQDYGRGFVLGTQTFGKGSVQTIMNLNHGQLKITQAMYYRVTGKSTQNGGVTPDITFPSLLDTERIGEGSHENALELATIPAAKFEPAANLSNSIFALKLAHQKRVEHDPYFDYYRAVEERIQENRDIASVSLNEDRRETRRKQSAAWRLRTENSYLMAFGEVPVKTVDELDDALNELSDRLEREVDGMALEAGRILVDYMEMRPTLAMAEKTVDH